MTSTSPLFRPRRLTKFSHRYGKRRNIPEIFEDRVILTSKEGDEPFCCFKEDQVFTVNQNLHFGILNKHGDIKRIKTERDGDMETDEDVILGAKDKQVSSLRRAIQKMRKGEKKEEAPRLKKRMFRKAFFLVSNSD